MILTPLLVLAMIKHTVMFRLQSSADLETVKAGLLALPEQIPTIIDYEIGQDLCLSSGQNHPAGPNRMMVWSAVFQTIDDYEAYAVDPAHVHFLQKILGPVVEPGSRAAIQYEIMDKK